MSNPKQSQWLRAGDLLGARRNNPSRLDSLFNRAQAIRALLREEAQTVDDVCEHRSLSDDQKRFMLDRCEVKIRELGQEVRKIVTIVEQSN